MRAITLKRPWAYAVARLGKRVENRPRRVVLCARGLVGERVAVHSGFGFDWEGFQWCQRVLGVAGDRPGDRGMILATATVAGIHLPESPFSGVAEDPFFAGDCAVVLADVVALIYGVACSGKQGWWTLPPDVEEQVLASRVF
ncbi:MAG: hypothetical protein L3J73_04375 [Thermoplasmata archaeon]|nr:hypothetical protein [Thermoplasmata archaeon]